MPTIGLSSGETSHHQTHTAPTRQQPPVERSVPNPLSEEANHGQRQIHSVPSTPERGHHTLDLYEGAFDETPPRREHWDVASLTTTEQLDQFNSRNNTPMRASQTGPSPIYRDRRGSDSTTTTEQWAQVAGWEEEWKREGFGTPVRRSVGFFQSVLNRLQGVSTPRNYIESPFRSPPPTPTAPLVDSSAPSLAETRGARVARRLFMTESDPSPASTAMAVEKREPIHWGQALATFSIVPLALFLLNQVFNSSQE